MTLSEFEQYAKEHGIVPVSTDIYKKMISDSVILSKHKEVLQEIRQEIYKPQQAYALKGLYTESSEDYGIHVGLTMALEVIDKHIAEGNYAQ